MSDFEMRRALIAVGCKILAVVKDRPLVETRPSVTFFDHTPAGPVQHFSVVEIDHGVLEAVSTLDTVYPYESVEKETNQCLLASRRHHKAAVERDIERPLG